MSVQPALWWVAAVLIGLCFVRLRWYAIVCVVVLSVGIGMARGSSVQRELRPLQQLAGQTVTLRGVISEDPHVIPRGDTQLVISQLENESHATAGAVWVTLRGEQIMERGDRIVINGKTKPGFGQYQLTMTYPTLDSVAASHDPMIRFRDQFVAALRRAVVEPAASLGVGFVVGQKTALPHQLDEQLRLVGLTHLVVASGYNLTILVRAAKRLFEKRSKFLVAFSTGCMVMAFIAISGASPSMVRAGIVAGLSMATWYYGRRFHPLMLIVYVMALTAMINPQYVWADIGWWLSFLAFAGVLIISPLILHLLYRRRKTTPHSLVQIVCETIAAQLMTLPLILLVFGKLPVLAILANVLTAPLIPFAMLLTALAGLGAMVLPVWAPLIGLPAEILLSYFIAVVRTLALPTWTQADVSLTVPQMIGLYSMVVGVTAVIWRKTMFNFRSQSIVE